MKKLFVHHPLFRLLSPLFSGILVYLLLLLINNTIDQLQDTFLGQELYVCIGLAYIIQEFSRYSLLFFKSFKKPKSFLTKLILQTITSVLLTIVLVTVTMILYFKYVLLFTPNSRELLVFNSIFVFITIIYVILFVAHYYLHKINTEKLTKEKEAKAAIEDSFKEFKKGINPDLLFESLEALLVLMKKDADKAEALADRFSSIYRYILTKKNNELVAINEELYTLEELVALLNQLPYRKVSLQNSLSGNSFIVPCTLLQIIETIVKTTVVSENQKLIISIEESEGELNISYNPEEKLRDSFTIDSIQDILKSYSFYTDQNIRIAVDGIYKSIFLPQLYYETE